MTFWEAYEKFRTEFPLRPEVLAVEIQVSPSAVSRWDRSLKNKKLGRNPSHYNRVRISDLARKKGASDRVVRALEPEAAISEARAT